MMRVISALHISALLLLSLLCAARAGEPGPAATLKIIAGDNQSATVNTNVPVAPKVQVVDANGQAVPFAQVTFAVGFGGGSITGGTQTTDANGFATVGSWKLGTLATPNTLSATVASIAPVTFTANATSDTPVSIAIFAGNNQSAATSRTLPLQVCVIVKDVYGNGVPNVNVSFIVATGGGEVTGGFTKTNLQGIGVAGAWRMGPKPGVNTIDASAENVPGKVTFTATGTNLPPVLDSVVYQPAAPVARSPVTFTVMAHDPEKDLLEILYDFGDGTVNQVPSHTYILPGTYTVTIRIGDGINVIQTQLQVVVSPAPVTDLNGDDFISTIDTDADGDGFPDYIETALGTNSLDPALTPFDGKSAGAAIPFGMTLEMTAYPKLPGQDKLKIRGVLPITAVPALKNSVLLFDIAGFTQKFVLNGGGSARTATGKFSLRFKLRPAPHANFTVTMKNETIFPFVRLNTPSDVRGYPDHAVVSVLYNNQICRSIVPLQYKIISNGGLAVQGMQTVK